jgi:hypothetical protein
VVHPVPPSLEPDGRATISEDRLPLSEASAILAPMEDAGGTSEFAVALIAGGLGLIGAIVGGLLTQLATARVEEQKQAFERERDAERDRRQQEQELKLARVTALASYPRYQPTAAIFQSALQANISGGNRCPSRSRRPSKI